MALPYGVASEALLEIRLKKEIILQQMYFRLGKRFAMNDETTNI